MQNSQATAATVPVALLYQADDLGGHLKTALHELGADIVYESQASSLDRAALAGSGARIVVFNLDPEAEGEIDHVYDVLDQGNYEVVFNDSDASSRLSGTDQARWARHLAAKILHKPEIATPPRPAWAESVPAPGTRAIAPAAAPAPAAPNAPVAPPALSVVAPVASAPAPTAAPAAVEPPPPPPAPIAVESAAAQAPPASDIPTLELPLLDGFNLEDVDVAPAASSAPTAGNDFASAIEGFAAQIPAQQHAPSADEFASELEALFADSRGGPVQDHEADEPAASSAPTPSAATINEDGGIDFPGIFDQLDAAAASVPQALDGSFRPAPLPGRDTPAPDVAANPLLPPEWSLEPLDDAPAATPAKPIEKSSAFGIETMSATEFLAPEDEAVVSPITPAGDAFSLELMPMEEAVAPQAYAPAPDPTAAPHADVPAAKFQLGAASQLRRVVVLGASIGGPEAVREFLGALPANFPALFVLAQHMGDEFLELMSMQLAKAVKLTVRTPTHGERVGHGEVVIVPTRQRMQIDGEGVITLSPLIERTAYSPSIDQVMRDVADEFGAKASAIVFSGMAQDAIEGSRQLTSRGGSVWVQDPDTCTISTMVESVRQTGTVSFVGSPQQLAEKMIADFGGK